MWLEPKLVQPWSDPAIGRAYRLLSEARDLRDQLEVFPYGGRVRRIYHRALKRIERRRVAYYEMTERLLRDHGL